VTITFLLLGRAGCSKMLATELPECASAEAIGLVKDKINEKLLLNAAQMRIDALQRGSNAAVAEDEVIDISEAKQVIYEEEKKTLQCRGIAEARIAGKVPVLYTFRLLNDDTIDVSVSIRQ
jgi:hypothetical protein